MLIWEISADCGCCSFPEWPGMMLPDWRVRQVEAPIDQAFPISRLVSCEGDEVPMARGQSMQLLHPRRSWICYCWRLKLLPFTVGKSLNHTTSWENMS